MHKRSIWRRRKRSRLFFSHAYVWTRGHHQPKKQSPFEAANGVTAATNGVTAATSKMCGFKNLTLKFSLLHSILEKVWSSNSKCSQLGALAPSWEHLKLEDQTFLLRLLKKALMALPVLYLSTWVWTYFFLMMPYLIIFNTKFSLVDNRWRRRPGQAPWLELDRNERTYAQLQGIEIQVSKVLIAPNTSFMGWTASWKRKTAEILLGNLSLIENLKLKVFLQPCNFDKLVRNLPLGTAMLSKSCKFSPSPPTSQRDQIPLSNLFSASTSNAISWTKK